MEKLAKPDNETQLMIKSVDILADNFSKFEITTPQNYETAAGYLKIAKAKIKELEAKRKAATIPLDNAKDEIMSWFRPSLEKGKKIIDAINDAMNNFKRQQEAIAAQKQKEIAAQAKDDDVFTPPVEVNVPKVEGLKTRTNWKFEVLDVDKLDKKFLMPNEKLIQSMVDKLHDQAGDIVGKGSIRIYTTQTNF